MEAEYHSSIWPLFSVHVARKSYQVCPFPSELVLKINCYLWEITLYLRLQCVFALQIGKAVYLPL